MSPEQAASEIYAKLTEKGFPFDWLSAVGHTSTHVVVYLRKKPQMGIIPAVCGGVPVLKKVIGAIRPA